MLKNEIGRIQLKGVPSESDADMRSLASKYGERLQRLINNEFLLELHVNEHQTDGVRSRYEIKSKFSYPGATIASEKEEWDMMLATRLALDALNEQLRDKYHSMPVDRPAQESYRVTRVEEVEDGLRFLRK